MTDMAIRSSVAGGDSGDGEGPWNDSIEGALVCVDVRQETHDVKTFRLRPPFPRRYRFQPGQCLTLTVTIDAREVQRCYTIASSPLRPSELEITVKRTPGGVVSSWLHDRVRPGDTLSVTGPMGRFSTAEHPAGRYLFLSAGSGITPLMSMTRAIHERGTGLGHGVAGQEADVVFVHCARSPADIIFRDELRRIAARDPQIRVVAVCEDAPGERWTGLRGRLTRPMLESVVPDLVAREVFTCGPPPFMEAARTILAEVGVDPGRTHEETFVFPGAAAGQGAGAETSTNGAAAPTYSVELACRGRTIECDAGTPILQAAARAGVTLPSSCGEGVCGTCKTTMLAGSVDMDHAGGIRPREIAQNKILLCCSTPLEDLVLEA